MPALQTATAKATVDGKLVLKSGKSRAADGRAAGRFLVSGIRSATFIQIREAALVGGEEGSISDGRDAERSAYLEIKPTDEPTSAESMSPFTNWTTNALGRRRSSRACRDTFAGSGRFTIVNVKQKRLFATGGRARDHRLERRQNPEGRQDPLGFAFERAAFRHQQTLQRTRRSRATHSPAEAGATASECASTVPTAWQKWASNTTRSSSTITPASS